MRKEELRKRFVETASRILAEEGVNAITTRRIGREMHCNSANIYYYFKDLDELIAYASMESFTNYLKEVSSCCATAGSALEAYRTSWEHMTNTACSMPQLYEKLMYGKYSDDLGRVCAGYFHLFPEKEMALDPSIVKNVTDERSSGREKHIVIWRCVEDGWFTQQDADIMSRLLSCLQMELLQELISEKISEEEFKKRFWECADRMIAAFRLK